MMVKKSVISGSGFPVPVLFNKFPGSYPHESTIRCVKTRTSDFKIKLCMAGLIICALFLFTACKQQTNEAQSNKSEVPPFPPGLVDFAPYSQNPVFTGTGTNTWDKNIRERGYILKEGENYYMWYTGHTSWDTLSLGYATSPDGIHWTRHPDNPIFSESWTEDMMVTKIGDIYYMFAEGKNDIAHYLTSTDRINWTDHGALDIRNIDGSPINEGPYGTPTAWKENDTWYLLFERGDLGIWLATSKDLKIWTKVQDEPVIEMGPEWYDKYGLAVNQVIKKDGWYYAYYHGTPKEDWSVWNTNVAASKDLIHWTKFPGNPILEDNKSSGILVEVDGVFRMYTMHDQVALHFPAYSNIQIKGVYGNPKPLWEKGFNLADLGVNSIFVHSGSIDSTMMERAGKEGLKVYSEFATLNGKNYVDKHPEAWAINEKGEKVEAAGWFMGVCPTEPGFRKYRFDQLRTLLSKYDLDGVWMDYVHWHAQFEEPEPILPETCFNDPCLNAFSKASGISIIEGTTAEKADWILSNHDTAWRKWRSEVIVEWAVEMKKIIKELKPDALLGLYHCPWDDQEFDSARYRILGLDYDLLKETIDVFSPMVYHERMGRSPEWVAENIEWFSNKIDFNDDSLKLWPIVQASDVAPEPFKIVMEGGLAGKSTGVMMFTTYAVAEDPEKIEVMKKIYENTRN